jgi:hypothetical protein
MFKKKNKGNIELESYNEDITIANKEEEIFDKYNDLYEYNK